MPNNSDKEFGQKWFGKNGIILLLDKTHNTPKSFVVFFAALKLFQWSGMIFPLPLKAPFASSPGKAHSPVMDEQHSSPSDKTSSEML